VADSKVLVGIITQILDELIAIGSNWSLILDRIKKNKFEIIKGFAKIAEDYENKNLNDLGIQVG